MRTCARRQMRNSGDRWSQAPDAMIIVNAAGPDRPGQLTDREVCSGIDPRSCSANLSRPLTPEHAFMEQALRSIGLVILPMRGCGQWERYLDLYGSASGWEGISGRRSASVRCRTEEDFMLITGSIRDVTERKRFEQTL